MQYWLDNIALSLTRSWIFFVLVWADILADAMALRSASISFRPRLAWGDNGGPTCEVAVLLIVSCDAGVRRR
jgi:hypothetical protein